MTRMIKCAICGKEINGKYIHRLDKLEDIHATAECMRHYAFSRFTPQDFIEFVKDRFGVDAAWTIYGILGCGSKPKKFLEEHQEAFVKWYFSGAFQEGYTGRVESWQV